MTAPHPDYYAGVKDAVHAHAVHRDGKLLVGTMQRELREVYAEIDAAARVGERYAGGMGGDLTRFVQPERASTFAVAIQVQTIVEGEDADGYYKAEEVSVAAKALQHALIDELGRTESGMGFDTFLEVDGRPATVKVEWERSWFLPPKHD